MEVTTPVLQGKELSVYLLKIREKLKKTSTEFAQILGVSLKELERWESNSPVLDRDLSLKICTLLNITKNEKEVVKDEIVDSSNKKDQLDLPVEPPIKKYDPLNESISNQAIIELPVYKYRLVKGELAKYELISIQNDNMRFDFSLFNGKARKDLERDFFVCVNPLEFNCKCLMQKIRFIQDIKDGIYLLSTTRGFQLVEMAVLNNSVFCYVWDIYDTFIPTGKRSSHVIYTKDEYLLDMIVGKVFSDLSIPVISLYMQSYWDDLFKSYDREKGILIVGDITIDLNTVDSKSMTNLMSYIGIRKDNKGLFDTADLDQFKLFLKFLKELK